MAGDEQMSQEMQMAISNERRLSLLEGGLAAVKENMTGFHSELKHVKGAMDSGFDSLKNSINLLTTTLATTAATKQAERAALGIGGYVIVAVISFICSTAVPLISALIKTGTVITP